MHWLRSLFTLALLGCASVASAAAPSLGSQDFQAGVSGVATLTLATVDTGSAIKVVHWKTSASNRTMAITDSDGATYTLEETSSSATCSSATCVEIYATYGHVSNASLTVTCTQGGGAAVGFSCGAIEIQPGASGTLSLDTDSHIVEGSNVTSHVSSADSTVIDTTTNVLVMAACGGSGTLGTKTAGSGYTALTNGDPSLFWQYQSSATALTDERGAWTSGTARACIAVISSTKETATAAVTPRGTLLGVLP